VKHSKAAVRGKARPALDIRFEPQNLTSYSGLILFQHFFSLIGIKERLSLSGQANLMTNSLPSNHGTVIVKITVASMD
jgi:hypothetical protein